MKQQVETVIIGGGQTGLTVGYYLARRGRSFVILDENKRIGDAWRNRWDSLKLQTPAFLNNLPGMPFPGHKHASISKDQMADYLETYAVHCKLDVLTDHRVESVSKEGKNFIVSAGDQVFESKNVVVAMSGFQIPKIPEFAKDIDPSIFQIHSKDYRNPSQLKEGRVLIVGLGNSGAEIAMDVVKSHKTIIAGQETGYLPFPMDSIISQYVLIHLYHFIQHYIYTTDNSLGRKLKQKVLSKGEPLIRIRPVDLINAGIERVLRVVSTQIGLPVLADNRVLEVENIIWCTGFNSDYSWIKLPVFDTNGNPLEYRGFISKQPGLYFVGLKFQYAMTSDTITGMKRDARDIVQLIINDFIKH